jgi:hypothetical protein
MENPAAPEQPDVPKRAELLYKDTTDNLRFFKQQQWTITRYALAAYAALYAASKIAKTGCLEKALLVAAVWLVAVFSLVVLHRFIVSLEDFRGRIAWFYRTHFPCEEREALGLGGHKDQFNRAGLIWSLMGLSLAGAIISTVAILQLGR